MDAFWRLLKTLEGGLENGAQVIIGLWLMVPFYPIIMAMSWEELQCRTGEGSKMIVSLGYHQASFLDFLLAKQLFAVIGIIVTQSSKKLDKPGMPSVKKYLLAFPLVVSSTLLQVVSKIYALTYLFLLQVPGFYKYPIFMATNIWLMVAIRLTTEVRLSEVIAGNLLGKLKVIVMAILSSMSSIFIKIDLDYQSYKKRQGSNMFVGQLAYTILQVHVNIFLIYLPELFPGFYPTWFKNDFQDDLWKIVTAWLVANLLMVSIYLSKFYTLD